MVSRIVFDESVTGGRKVYMVLGSSEIPTDAFRRGFFTDLK